MKKSSLSFLIICTIASSVHLHGASITTELVGSALKGTSEDFDADAYGWVFLRPYESDYITSDVHYRFGHHWDRLNVANIKLLVYQFDATVGRQLIAWGSGYNFNPTDVFNTKPLGAAFDPVYYKTGRDAVTVSGYAGEYMVDAVYALDYTVKNRIDDDSAVTEKGDDDIGMRVKKNFYGYDVALSYVDMSQRTYSGIIEKEDRIAGLSIKGSLPVLDWGIWFEGARYVDQEITEFVSGLEYVYDKWTFNMEYYRNGFGDSDSSMYNFDLQIRGRVIGRDYVVPSVSCQMNEKWVLTGFVFSNLNDSSSVAGGVIEYFVNDYVEVALIPLVLTGGGSSEFGIQQDIFGTYGATGLIKISF